MSIASQVSQKNGKETQKSLPVEVFPYFFRQKVTKSWTDLKLKKYDFNDVKRSNFLLKFKKRD